MYRQGFAWIVFSAAISQKKKSAKVSQSGTTLWIYCMFILEISVATPPCGSKVEGTVNSLDGKLHLHVEHYVIQAVA